MKLDKKMIYFIGLFFMCLISWDFFSAFIEFSEMAKHIFIIISCLCFILSTIFSKYRKKELIIFTVISIFALISSIACGDYRILLTYMAIISSKNIDNKDIVKTFFRINIIMIIFHVIITALGIDAVNKNFYTFSDGHIRKSFNMRHPNYLAGVIFWIMASYCYLNQNKNKIKTLLIVFCTMIVSYIFTFSRTTIPLYLILMIIIFINNERDKNLTITILKILMILLIITSVFASFYYQELVAENNIWIEINEILSDGLYWSSIQLDSFELTLFGRDISSVIDTALNVDSFYVSCLIQYGSIHMMILLTAFIKIRVNKQNYYEYMLIIVLLITGISEKYIINVVLAFPLLFFKNIIFKDCEDRKEIVQNKNTGEVY